MEGLRPSSTRCPPVRAVCRPCARGRPSGGSRRRCLNSFPAPDFGKGSSRSSIEARHFEAAERSATVGDQLLDRHVAAPDDDRVHGFAPARVGDAEHGDLVHGGMLGEHGLDFDRVDVLERR